MATPALGTGVHDNGHLGLYPRCGICADIVFTNERVIGRKYVSLPRSVSPRVRRGCKLLLSQPHSQTENAYSALVFGNSDSTSYLGHTRSFDFPPRGHTITRVDGRLLCRYPDCKRCAASPEFAPIHSDCFDVFRQQCSVSTSCALDRLWTLAAWRHPWRGAQPIYLSAPRVDKDILRTISGFCGLPRLYTLPTELLEMIRRYSRHSLLWRCVPALQLAAHVSTMKPNPLLTVPLRDLLSWDRGGKFERLVGFRVPSESSTLRLTIDSAGISKLERLPKPPMYIGEYTNRFAYIVQEEESISHVMAQLKNGRLRLKFPVRSRILPIWNTPAPPNLSLCKAYPAALTSCPIIQTVEMNGISGVTFFFAFGQLFGIHIHRSEESCAMDTFARNLSDRLQRSVVWIYLPISRPDIILVLGIREVLRSPSLNVLVRTALIGDVVVGSQSKGQAKDILLDASGPLTMVYGEPREGDPVSSFGAYRGRSSDQTLPPPFRLINRGPCPINDAYFSWAPLRDVSSTLVFYDQETGFCRGIVFCYQNRGLRAVGQCRLQVDPADRFVQPVRLCFRTRPYGNQHIYNVQVKFNPTETDSEGWESRPMEGLVKFWFTPESSFLVVEN
ncbi:hypothetical protein CONLIGDRAFT_625286 [Coniochaeta ligniaria NRRL 30616]|uniref:Uncharacterized protein n=1 Tax=Coniochaeta ligniaria NRRL 30616 TaxID=1408157 RepID=A0A1J7J649_9PEZI|nr:hypothetical protein CONLIGDRAFT_625286 [Coniochaeta ligniaria NRRL 30616]